MKFISHRGNTTGSNPAEENSPKYINDAIQQGFDVEVDVWVLEGRVWLGHDQPTYRLDEHNYWHYLQDRSEVLWCHAKNEKALEYLLSEGLHCFWHQEDDRTLTSKGFIWTYPGKPLIDGAIAVMPERVDGWDLKRAGGICSDRVFLLAKEMKLNL